MKKNYEFCPLSREAAGLKRFDLSEKEFSRWCEFCGFIYTICVEERELVNRQLVIV